MFDDFSFEQTSLPAGWRLATADFDDSLVSRILQARGYESADDQRIFLSPKYDRDTYEAKLLKDVDLATERLAVALEKQEVVAIYGDYDADGIPATALMLRGLDELGFKHLLSHIPTRVEGYGLQKKVIKQLADQGTKVIITVDTGIAANEEVDYANSLGIDVIITDHHEPLNPPKALAIINPKQAKCRYPNQHLSGTAVAYKLLWALYEKLGKDHTKLKWMIDLVGISLISDMMPLVGENRALAYYGLRVLRKTKNVGLQALIRVAGLDRASVAEREVAFAIAPRINALSRLAKETAIPNDKYDHLALALLMSDDQAEALELAAIVNQINQERRDLVEQYTQLVKEKIGTVPEGGLVFYDESIPSGVTGLVAGELSQQSGWPCLVMGNEQGNIRGSGRSATSLSMVDLLQSHRQLLSRFGGHHEAAGWTVKPGSLDNFLEAVQTDLDKLKDQHPRQVLVEADTYLYPEEATMEAAHALSALAPFGVGNAKPLLLIRSNLTAVNSLRNGHHFRLKLAQNYPEAVWFNAPDDSVLTTGQSYFLAVNLEINDYFDQPRPQLVVKHLIPSSEQDQE